MARSNAGFVCHIHRDLVSYEVHHIFPVGYGGPDVAANRIKICPNAHSDIHFLMDKLLAGKPVDLREYGPSIRKWASLGAAKTMTHIQALIEDMSPVRG